MPNGFDGSREDWERMEAPFLKIDDLLSQFAADQNMQLNKNYHSWPRRDLHWTTAGIDRRIQLFAADRPGTYHVAVIAWKDDRGGRSVNDHWLEQWATWPAIEARLLPLLEEARTILESWSEKDLKSVG